MWCDVDVLLTAAQTHAALYILTAPGQGTHMQAARLRRICNPPAWRERLPILTHAPTLPALALRTLLALQAARW